MATKRTLEILRDFKKLKKRKKSLDPDQYVYELKLLKMELEIHLRNPQISQEEETALKKLMAIKPKN